MIGAVYTGTKHFVEGMSKCLRLELAGTEVRVTNIQPGFVDTEIFETVVDQEVSFSPFGRTFRNSL